MIFSRTCFGSFSTPHSAKSSFEGELCRDFKKLESHLGNEENLLALYHVGSDTTNNEAYFLKEIHQGVHKQTLSECLRKDTIVEIDPTVFLNVNGTDLGMKGYSLGL